MFSTAIIIKDIYSLTISQQEVIIYSYGLWGTLETYHRILKECFMGTDIYTTVAEQLRLKRLQAGLTIEALAHAAEISTSFLAYLETNKKKPSVATIAKLAAALGISVSELFNEKAVPRIAGEKRKALNRLLKLLQNQSPENTETILATAAVLSKKLLRGR